MCFNFRIRLLCVKIHEQSKNDPDNFVPKNIIISLSAFAKNRFYILG